ncbi:MAG: glycosyltransferase family 1 protein [Candidatus Omnitrophota bacterium]
MKIGIDIRSTLKKTRTGIGNYTLDLVSSLAKIDSLNDYCLYGRKKLIDLKRKAFKLPGPNFRYIMDYLNRGPYKIFKDLDVFHTSSYDLKRPKGARFFVTVHDVINKAYPEGHDTKTLKEIDEKLKYTLSEADTLIADSLNTKKDLIRFYDVEGSRIKVIYPGIDKRFSSMDTEPGNKKDYILFVGTIEPRKNIKNLIKAFELLKKEHSIKEKLYIVGMKGWMYEDVFKEYEGSEFKKDIVFKGRVDHDELIKLYKEALLFVYPSFYEGFGFPVIEAFLSGTAVVTSKTSSCGEIAGDSAMLIDPYDHKDIAKGMFSLIHDEALREKMIIKGKERARAFDWADTAKEFLGLFSEGRV